MITTAEEYNSHLHILNNINPPIYATIPSAETIYNIDLNTRTVEAPKFLGVLTDNKAETIYFMVDRFVDYMDLTDTCCVINYTNAEGKSGIYGVPFYDIFTYADDHKILLPWVVDGYVTKKKGKVQFAIQFFKIKEEKDAETNKVIKSLVYNLNTKPAYSEVLESMKLGEQIGELDEDLVQYNDLLSKIVNLENRADDNYGTYWTILD